MVLELANLFAMRCPACGRLGTDPVNIFDLSGKSQKHLSCGCGSEKAVIWRNDKKKIGIRYYCIICEVTHRKLISASKFWSKDELHSFHCLKTGLNLGYYGPYHLIRAELDRQQAELNSMADELGFEDFVDPELMLEILDYLHDLAASGRLVCACDSKDINVELFFDRVELNCNDCQASLNVPAASREDIKHLRSCSEVVLDVSPPSPSSPNKDPWINI